MQNLRKVEVERELEEFIVQKNHPCIMAQSIFKQSNYTINVYKEFGSQNAAHKIITDLKDYIRTYNFESNDLLTFIAVFDIDQDINELTFEILLWQQLQNISDIDKIPWDKNVSPNPMNEEFSFSILGHAFYIVGMHPNSARKARQSPYPCLVFNLHSQFESLRKKKVYNQVRDRIRSRDKKLNGSVNPMLANFGHSSEAKQYSGRAVSEDWKCPFSQNKSK